MSYRNVKNIQSILFCLLLIIVGNVSVTYPLDLFRGVPRLLVPSRSDDRDVSEKIRAGIRADELERARLMTLTSPSSESVAVAADPTVHQAVQEAGQVLRALQETAPPAVQEAAPPAVQAAAPPAAPPAVQEPVQSWWGGLTSGVSRLKAQLPTMPAYETPSWLTYAGLRARASELLEQVPRRPSWSELGEGVRERAQAAKSVLSNVRRQDFHPSSGKYGLLGPLVFALGVAALSKLKINRRRKKNLEMLKDAGFGHLVYKLGKPLDRKSEATIVRDIQRNVYGPPRLANQ